MCRFMCILREVMAMAPNLQIDDKLIQEVVRLGHEGHHESSVS